MPVSYSIYLKRLILIYCLILPVSIVNELGWWTPVAVAFVSFILLGVDRIGNEIENPFGYEHNNLPLDEICNDLKQAVEQIAHFKGLPEHSSS